MKASELATKLRKLADALDKAPDAEINPYVSISPRNDDKETFLELAKVLPRPLTKKIRHEGTSYEDFTLEGDGFVLGIPRSRRCRVLFSSYFFFSFLFSSRHSSNWRKFCPIP